MNTEVAFQLLRPSFALSIVGILIFQTAAGYAQSRDSKPIKFSKPRDNGDPPASSEEFSPEKRRLTDLEESLSKTFNFLDFEDSMSGAPAPRALRRVIAPKQPSTSGLLEDENWMLSDSLSKLRDSMRDEEGFIDGPFDLGQREDYVPKGANFLNSLRSEDWLVNAARDETYWEKQTLNSPEANKRSSAELSTPQVINPFNMSPAEPLRPRLEGLLGRSEHPELYFRERDVAARPFIGGNDYELGQPVKSRSAVRHDEYRALLGLAAKDATVRQPKKVVTDSPGFERNSLTTSPFSSSTRTGGSPRNDSRRSLYGYGVPSEERSSLYPAAPTAPQKPSVLDSFEIGQPTSTTPTPAGVITSPFYQPPQRQF